MATTVGSSLGLTQHDVIDIRPLWRGMTAACRYLAREVTPRHRKVYASGVSDEWLRCYAIESAKHVDDS